MRLIHFAVVVMLILTACSSDSHSFESLPAGDANRGADLFTQTIGGIPACSSCHNVQNASTLIGPGLQGYATISAGRVADLSASEYTYISIVRPSAHVVEGFGNSMYNQYGQRLTPQQIADLIAYLLTL